MILICIVCLKVNNFYWHNFLIKPVCVSDISPNIQVFNGNLVIVKPIVEFNLWMHYLYTISYASKQNLSKFFIEIIKTFLVIVFGLSIIALTEEQ